MPKGNQSVHFKLSALTTVKIRLKAAPHHKHLWEAIPYRKKQQPPKTGKVVLEGKDMHLEMSTLLDALTDEGFRLAKLRRQKIEDDHKQRKVAPVAATFDRIRPGARMKPEAIAAFKKLLELQYGTYRVIRDGDAVRIIAEQPRTPTNGAPTARISEGYLLIS